MAAPEGGFHTANGDHARSARRWREKVSSSHRLASARWEVISAGRSSNMDQAEPRAGPVVMALPEEDEGQPSDHMGQQNQAQ